jgi:hypothetical protein
VRRCRWAAADVAGCRRTLAPQAVELTSADLPDIGRAAAAADAVPAWQCEVQVSRFGEPEGGVPRQYTVFDAVRGLQRSTTLALALSPVGIILIAATRLLIVSDYKVSTATAIVGSDGYVNTLFGSLIPIVPLLIPYLAFLLLLSRRFIVGVLALLAAALVSPAIYTRAKTIGLLKADMQHVWEWSLSGWPHWLIFVPTTIAVGLLLFSTVFGMPTLARTFGALLAVALIPFALQLYPLPYGPTYYAHLLKQPWLPEERIILHGQPAVVGYVLADSDVSLEVLRQTDRSVVFYTNALIGGEQICQSAPDNLVRPLVPLTPLRHPAPSCEPPSPLPRPLLDRGAENPSAVKIPPAPGAGRPPTVEGPTDAP